MADTQGFYAVDSNNYLQYAPNAVDGPGFNLAKEDKDTYTYPVNGWSWFDTEEAAVAALHPTPHVTSLSRPDSKELSATTIEELSATTISGADFVLRFTGDERDAIMASTDPIVVAYMAKVKISPVVHLDGPDVTQGLPYLVSLGLITSERAAVIGYY